MSENFYSDDFLVGPEHHCPWCGHRLTAVGQANREVCEAPEAGDRTVCIACAQVAVFGMMGELRKAEPGEIDDEVRQVQADIRRMHSKLN